MEPTPVDHDSPAAPPKNPLRKTDVRKQTRPTLLPSRTNSRPDLARYTSGSSLHLSNSLHTSLGRSSSGRVLVQSQQTDTRRDKIIECVMALPRGCVEEKESKLFVLAAPSALGGVALGTVKDGAPPNNYESFEEPPLGRYAPASTSVSSGALTGAYAYAYGEGAYASDAPTSLDHGAEPAADSSGHKIGGYATISMEPTEPKPFLQVGAAATVEQLDRFHRMLDELRGGVLVLFTSLSLSHTLLGL
jgi:hypothetical protein